MATKTIRRKPTPKTRIEGAPLHNPASIERRYEAELRALVRQMAKETKEEVLALFRGTEAKQYFANDASLASLARQALTLLSARFDRLYSRHSQLMARRMAGAVDAQSTANLNRSFAKMTDQVTIKVKDMPRDMFEAIIDSNVRLIKSIPQKYLDDVSGSVFRSIADPNGGGIGKLTEDLSKYDGISYRRAKNIAMNETRRAYQGVNIQKAKDSGIKKGTWLHTGGSKEPRPAHKAYNGKEFDLSKGAPIGKNGEYVLPSEEIGCRCGWVPVIDFGDF